MNSLHEKLNVQREITLIQLYSHNSHMACHQLLTVIRFQHLHAFILFICLQQATVKFVNNHFCICWLKQFTSCKLGLSHVGNFVRHVWLQLKHRHIAMITVQYWSQQSSSAWELLSFSTSKDNAISCFIYTWQLVQPNLKLKRVMAYCTPAIL